MIGIIDYGLGNIRAFANVYKRLNMQHKIVFLCFGSGRRNEADSARGWGLRSCDGTF